MHFDVKFELKRYSSKLSDQLITTEINSVATKIIIENENCIIQLAGSNREDIERIFYSVWELLALYDGYFYLPIEWMIDGESENDLSKIFKKNFRKTAKFWKQGATLLGENERLIDESVVRNYTSFRSRGRQQGKMFSSIVNTYFWVISDSYREVNIEHKLSLLLNGCDGYYINMHPEKKSKNAGGNIVKLINEIAKEKVQYGLGLLGISKNHITELFGGVRNEIDHYISLQYSVGDYKLKKPDNKALDNLNIYLLYVIELTLRTTLLKNVGGNVKQKAVNRAIDGINDWLILQCGFSEKCALPENQIKQMEIEFLKEQSVNP